MARANFDHVIASRSLEYVDLVIGANLREHSAEYLSIT